VRTYEFQAISEDSNNARGLCVGINFFNLVGQLATYSGLIG